MKETVTETILIQCNSVDYDHKRDGWGRGRFQCKERSYGIEARGLSTWTLKGLQMEDDNVGSEVFKDSVEVT